MKEKINGIVKWYNNQKLFGFIAGDDGNDYFIHKNELIDLIREGDNVQFETKKSPKGPCATNVEKIAIDKSSEV